MLQVDLNNMVNLQVNAMCNDGRAVAHVTKREVITRDGITDFHLILMDKRTWETIVKPILDKVLVNKDPKKI